MPRSLNHLTKNVSGKKSKFDRQFNKINSKEFRRLAGGADSPKGSEEPSQHEPSEQASNVASNEPTSQEEVTVGNSESEAVDTVENQLQKCLSLDAIESGDKQVDDLIRYVQKNLCEACEALASLGDNIEHEIKLMFVEVIAQIRKWISSTGDKLEKSITETKNLHKEFKNKMEYLADRESEIEDLKNKLASAESAKQSLEKSLPRDKSKREKGEKGGEKGEGEEGGEGQEEDDSSKPRESSETMEDGSRRLSETSSQMAERLADKEEKMAAEAEKMLNERQAELEKEIECLKKENERLIKEQTEYENAVQRALLKGVSSLNVEALKVMRNPPTCYDPCGPTSTFIEPVPCGQKNLQDAPLDSRGSNCSDTPPPKKSHTRKICTNVNCPAAKHRKKCGSSSFQR